MFKFIRFLKHYISQGIAATSLRCGGIYNANSVLSLAVKEFRKSINISRSYQHE